MPRVQKEVVAILGADWHLMHKPPLARLDEEDWYEAQGRYLDQIRKLQGVVNPIPVIVAGDLFHKWNPPVELVNFALKRMPVVHAVPGQHDLPNHQYSLIGKSAYWTLVEAGKVINIPAGKTPLEVVSGNPLRLWGFPWGFPVRGCIDPPSICLDIAVIHDYIWSKQETCFYGADKEKKVNKWASKLRGYHLAVFGDNHIPFKLRNDEKDLTILNCGSLMRLTVSQRDYQPAVWLLRKDGSVVRHLLDISQDKFLEGLEEKGVEKDLSRLDEFLHQLTTLSESAIDFSSAVLKFLREEKIGGKVKHYILKALDKVK